MNTRLHFWKDESGGPAAEFALVLPLALTFLLGTIDVGRYMWEVNRAQKATQMGTRYAVATDVVASGLAGYDFSTQCATAGGDAIDSSKFSAMICTGGGDITAPTASCTLAAATGCANDIPTDANAAAMANIVTRMRMFKNDIQPANVTISYSNSGIGFAGFPNRIDVAPIVSISVSDLDFDPLLLTLFGGTIEFPTLTYSLTLEDGQGTISN